VGSVSSLSLCVILCAHAAPLRSSCLHYSLALVKKTTVMRVFIVSAVQCMHSRPARIMLQAAGVQVRPLPLLVLLC
jgi:hypothetical protein